MIDGRVFKRCVVKPNAYGVITIVDGFFSDEYPDPVTGRWEGWLPEGRYL